MREFMPCERELLISRTPKMEVFEGLATSMCDSFRQGTVVTGEEPWSEMDLAATSRLDRCMRVCKIKIEKVQDRSVKPIRPTPQQIQNFSPEILHMLSTYGDQQGLRCLYAMGHQQQLNRPPIDVQLASSIQSSLYCRPMPIQAKEIQEDAILQLFGGCKQVSFLFLLLFYLKFSSSKFQRLIPRHREFFLLIHSDCVYYVQYKEGEFFPS
jgi:hypothetical protein